MNNILVLKGTYYGINYDFSMQTQCTIISGDSGTGKTLMFNILREHEASNHSILALNMKKSFDRDFNNALTDVNTLIVLDRLDYWAEEEDISHIEEAIHACDNRFILISRHYCFMLPSTARKRLVFKNNILQFE